MLAAWSCHLSHLLVGNHQQAISVIHQTADAMHTVSLVEPVLHRVCQYSALYRIALQLPGTGSKPSASIWHAAA
jgi:hypothetical protein